MFGFYDFSTKTYMYVVATRGGWVRQRCPVAFVTGASNWYWLTVGQGLLSLQQLKVERKCCYFFFSITFFHFPPSSLSLSFISSTISFLPFSGRRHKMTHKGWRVIKPQHNQSDVGTLEACHQGASVEYPQYLISRILDFTPLSQEGQLSVSGERMCTILVNRLED